MSLRVITVAVIALLSVFSPLASAWRGAAEVSAYTPMNIHMHSDYAGSWVLSYVTTSTATVPKLDRQNFPEAPGAFAYFGTSKTALTNSQKGDTRFFETEQYASYVHNVILKGLRPNTRYYYQLGNADLPNGLSPVYSFTTADVKKWAIFGDYGMTNMDRSLNALIADAQADYFQGVFHVGDIAYDLHNGRGKRGDDFIEDLQPVMTKMPYMYAVGNHEKNENFTHYNHRYRSLDHIGASSNSGTGLWFSLNIPNAHVTVINTEVFKYFPDAGQQQRQFNWLANDFAKANKERSRYPWLILLAHKCDWQDEVDYKQLRIMAHEAGVDVLICGHQHNYQRLFPGLRRQVQTYEDMYRYENPDYWTQIVVGSPGCQEKISKGIAPYKDGVANYFLSYGYGAFSIPNATHFLWEWKQTNRATALNGETPADSQAIFEQNESGKLGEEAEIKDWMTIVQHNHGPRAPVSAELANEPEISTTKALYSPAVDGTVVDRTAAEEAAAAADAEPAEKKRGCGKGKGKGKADRMARHPHGPRHPHGHGHGHGHKHHKHPHHGHHHGHHGHKNHEEGERGYWRLRGHRGGPHGLRHRLGMDHEAVAAAPLE